MAETYRGWLARGWTTKQVAWVSLGSLAIGAFLTYQAGFNWFGDWQTGEEVQKRMAVSACVQQFLLQEDRGVIYTQLQQANSGYQRRQLLRQHELTSDYGAADACEEQIRALDPGLFPPA